MKELYTYSIKKISKLALLTFVIILCLFILLKVSIYIAPFIIAFIISNLIEPIITFFMKKLKISRKASSAITLLLVLSSSILIITFLISRFISEIINMSHVLPGYITEVYNNLEAFFKKIAALYPGLPANLSTGIENLISNLSTSLIRGLNNLATHALNTAISIPQVVVFMLITLLSTYFLASDRTKIYNFFNYQLPEKWVIKVRSVKGDMLSALLGYIKAQLILMLITFLQLLAGFMIIGIKQPLTLATLICLVDALPILGSGSIMLPWSIYLFFVGNFFSGMSIVILYLIVFMVRQIMEPKLVSQQIGVHPLLTLFAMYIGLQLFGVVGMIIGPVTIILLKNIFSGALKNRPIKNLFNG